MKNVSANYFIAKAKVQRPALPDLAYHLFYYLIVIVLLFSGIAKIIDPLPLMETLKAVITVPDEIYLVTATILPVAEIALAVMLIMKIKLKITLPLVMLLFLMFFAFSVYGTAIGLNNDCGCFGIVVKSEFNILMVMRNLFLGIIAVYLIIKNKKLPPRGRVNLIK